MSSRLGLGLVGPFDLNDQDTAEHIGRPKHERLRQT